jgi:hypothetical protein
MVMMSTPDVRLITEVLTWPQLLSSPSLKEIQLQFKEEKSFKPLLKIRFSLTSLIMELQVWLLSLQLISMLKIFLLHLNICILTTSIRS